MVYSINQKPSVLLHTTKLTVSPLNLNPLRSSTQLLLPPGSQTSDLQRFFKGKPDHCGGFIPQCNLVFNRAPVTYSPDSARITYIISSLKGEVLRWTHAYLSSHLTESLTFQAFLKDFLRVFGYSLQEEAKRLLSLHQGRMSMSEFSICFWIVAEESGWVEKALRGAFVGSLNDQIKGQLATSDVPEDLDKLINLAIWT